MSGNYIKIDRKILKWEWYENINTKVVFLHCLLKANWCNTRHEGIEMPRGSFKTSLSKLSSELGLSIREIRTSLEHLESTGELTIKTTNKYRLITVNNYDLYQDSDKQNDKQTTNNLTSKRQASDKQATNKAEEKERSKEKEDINNNKKREEGKNKKNNNKTSCAEPETSSGSTQNTVAKIILNDKTFYEVQQEEIDRWSELYPAVDVMQEIRNMVGWSEANQAKRKTRRGIHRFITSWLEKAQNRGGSQNNIKATSNTSANRNLPGGLTYSEWRDLRNEQG